MHQPVVARTSGHPVGRSVLASLALGDQQLDGRADQALVLLPGDVVDPRHQPLVALLHDRLRHLLLEHGGRSAGPLGVLEGVGAGEPRLLDHVHRLEEVVLALAGEPHDDVGGDGRLGDGVPDPVDDPEVLRLAVGPAHRSQHPVGPGLQRHVQLRHDVRCLRHRGDDVVGELGGVRAGEAHSLQAVDVPARAEQLRERLPVAELDSVGVDVLPQQGDLADAVCHQRLDLGQDLPRPAVLLLAAQARHDAERAGVVAADRDRHPGGVRRLPLRRQRGREDLERLEDLDLRLLLHAGALEKHRERPDVVGAEDDVDPRRLAGDLAAILLRETATDGDLHAGSLRLDRREVAEVAVEPVVGVLAHRAGVEHDDVGGLALGCRPVARVLEQTGEPLGVVDVHLAPVGAHLVRACHGRVSLRTRPGHRGACSRGRSRARPHLLRALPRAEGGGTVWRSCSWRRSCTFLTTRVRTR